MKRIGLTLVAILLMTYPLLSQIVDIPDKGFLSVLLAKGVDSNDDKWITYPEAAEVKELDLSNMYISDLSGIEAFVNLESLVLYNNRLSNLDVSNNTALKVLDCSHNSLDSLDLSNNTALSILGCRDNQIKSLDPSYHADLTTLACSSNYLTHLDLSNNTALTDLYCENNQLTSLDISNNTALIHLYCDNNQIRNLNVSNHADLTTLECSHNFLTNLDVTSNPLLGKEPCNGNRLNCSYNQLTGLDVSNNPMLGDLDCSHNALTSLDVSNGVIIRLDCSYNELTNLDISWDTLLVGCYGASVVCGEGWADCICTSVNISNIPTLNVVYVHSLPLSFEVYTSMCGGILVDTSGSPNVVFDTISSLTSVPSKDYNKVKIFPNPTNGEIQIETDNHLKATIEIYNSGGRLIYRKPINSNQKRIDLSPFGKGIYFITIRSKDFISTRKFFKL